MENVRLISEKASEECVVARVNQAFKKDKSLARDWNVFLWLHQPTPAMPRKHTYVNLETMFDFVGVTWRLLEIVGSQHPQQLRGLGGTSCWGGKKVGRKIKSVPESVCENFEFKHSSENELSWWQSSVSEGQVETRTIISKHVSLLSSTLFISTHIANEFNVTVAYVCIDPWSKSGEASPPTSAFSKIAYHAWECLKFSVPQLHRLEQNENYDWFNIYLGSVLTSDDWPVSVDLDLNLYIWLDIVKPVNVVRDLGVYTWTANYLWNIISAPSSVPVSSIFAALNLSVESSVPMSRRVWCRICDNQNGLLQLHSGSTSSVVNRSAATGPECSRQTHHWHWNTRAHHSSAS